MLSFEVGGFSGSGLFMEPVNFIELDLDNVIVTFKDIKSIFYLVRVNQKLITLFFLKS